MGPPLRKLAMKLLLFQILALTVEVVFNLTPDEDQVAPALKVAQLDCSEMTENTLYAINQVRPCHITPEVLEISKAKIVLYTKQFRKELNATKCRVQHQREKWHCGQHDHSSIDHTIAGITSDIVNLSRTMSNSRERKSFYFAWTFDKFWFRQKKSHCKNLWWYQWWLKEWMWR